ncbi:MAG: hypothetical protein RL577_1550 [Bacteroidota bacterium]|jgi:hypothetical protein
MFEMKRILVVAVMLVSGTALVAQSNSKAQYKWDSQLSAYLAPTWNHRLLTGVTPPPRQALYTEAGLRDSFSRCDQTMRSSNLGLRITKKRSSFQAFSLGLSFSRYGFERIYDGEIFGYEVHPDVGIYESFVQGPQTSIVYQHRSTFLEFQADWHRRIDGPSFHLDKASLWAFGGVAPMVLLQHAQHIETVGFAMTNGSEFLVDELQVELAADDTPNYVPVNTAEINLAIRGGLRWEYELDPAIRLHFQPSFSALCWSPAYGTQTYLPLQLAMELGVILPLN